MNGLDELRRLGGRLGKRLGRPSPRDIVAGLVTGLFSIPEGMAYASIGGFNPVLGLYSGIVPTIVGALTARTVLMVTTLTSAIALSAQSVLAEAGLDPHDLGNVATLTVMVGAVMLLFGVLRLGAVMSFVSNAVMTGFTTGIAVQIIVGVLGDATGYDPHGHNKLRQIWDWIAHIGSWKLSAVLVAIGTIAVWAVTSRVRPLRGIATLIALLALTVVVAVIGVKVELVRDIAKIPSSLPVPHLPDLAAVPDLALGAVAVALVALAQAAGIGAAVPNPDGSRSSLNGDFTAQGLANLSGGFFQALPTGGSLSRTGVATGAGARGPWAGVFAGVWLALVVVTLGHYAELIPMPVIGGLILVVGGELVWERRHDIRLVLRTSWLSASAMIVTFLATTQLPLQQAILLGAALSLLLFCVRISREARLMRLTPGPDAGHWSVTDLPERLEPGDVVVLHYAGVSFFAELGRINDAWPRTDDARGAVLILSVRVLPDVPSSAVMKVFQRRARELQAGGGTLMIAGVSPALKRLLDETGTTAVIGADNIFPAEPEIFAPLDKAYARATRSGGGPPERAAGVTA
ncbi:SulP family inorganic anion transporter [Actinomadura barringtoniae]|uniref:SulP family inorganic anion transporter n=1 Tax=Actinomadura barringtoniae TaxID=1427535 RepID=A0A939P661_9ACTN|nr:SulP family inorganic anion transporter [Actinomadura barringtoniae]MBO2446023.1 SulP family inorganic anion transporter [Actinomadura barringtoniae]